MRYADENWMKKKLTEVTEVAVKKITDNEHSFSETADGNNFKATIDHQWQTKRRQVIVLMYSHYERRDPIITVRQTLEIRTVNTQEMHVTLPAETNIQSIRIDHVPMIIRQYFTVDSTLP